MTTGAPPGAGPPVRGGAGFSGNTILPDGIPIVQLPLLRFRQCERLSEAAPRSYDRQIELQKGLRLSGRGEDLPEWGVVGVPVARDELVVLHDPQIVHHCNFLLYT